ncbi:MAG: Mov34/MPN/PAD-1 family protein [Candidatus Altiarchaeota archaeon]
MDEARIHEGALEFILLASRNVHPREFTGQLRMEDDVITEVLVTPKSVYGQGFASTRFDMIPIDRSICGSVHSHPSESFNPSSADMRFFGKKGSVHLIAKYPFKDASDVAAYDRDGARIRLEVIGDD